jgi:hypothetical protein
VEELRATAASGDDTMVVIAASDPANVWWLPTAGDSFARPRGAGRLLVTHRGRVIVTSDDRGRSVALREELDAAVAERAVAALVRHVGARRGRDVIVEQINGQSAATSPWAGVFQLAGLRLSTAGLRYYASFDRA